MYSNAEDSLLRVVVSFCQVNGTVSPAARNHAAAALNLLAKSKNRDEERNKICILAARLLNQQSNLNPNGRSLEEDSSFASGYEETSPEQLSRNKRKIQHDPSDEPPSKKFKSDTRKPFQSYNNCHP